MPQNYPATVVGIRCGCKNTFNIRTNQARKSNQCHICLALYEVEQSVAGTVKVYITPANSFTRSEFTNFSNITKGE